MNKLITILGLVSFSIALVACGGAAAPAEPAAPVEEPAAEEPVIEEPAEEIEMMEELPLGNLQPQIELLRLPDAVIASQCQSAPSISSASCPGDLPSYNAAAFEDPGGPVVILVVDDFGSEPLWKLPESSQLVYDQPDFSLITGKPKEGDNCLMAPGGQGFYSSGGSGVGNFPVPHGELVFAKLEQLLSAWEFPEMPLMYAEDTQECWKRKVRLYGEEPYWILLVGVDTQNYNTQTVSNNIDAAIAEFGSYDNQLGLPPSNRFVINMSFAIIPCDAYTDPDATAETIYQFSDEIYNLADQNTFDPGLQELAVNLGDAATTVDVPESGESAPVYEDLWLDDQVANELLQPSRILGAYPNFFDFYNPYLFNAPPEEVQQYLEGLNKYFNADALVQQLNCYADRETYPHIVINVASAGNFYSYPFPFMPALLDSVVSISSDYSSIPDECQSIANDAGSNPGEIMEYGGYVNYQGKCYLGTSFAAPAVSTYMAWYLMVYGADLCDLGYASEYGYWENASFNDVLDYYCPSLK